MLYRGSASTIAADHMSGPEDRLAGTLAVHMTEQFFHTHQRKPSLSEIRSWERSIPQVAHALLDAGLGGVEMMLEYQLPLSSKRADIVLAGVHPQSREPSYLVVELKQWSHAQPYDGAAERCLVDGYGRPKLNPILQVADYCDYLVGFNSALARHPERIAGVAYLHNASEAGVEGLYDVGQRIHGRLFSRDRRGAFVEFLKTRFAPESGARAADELRHAVIKPSRQLMEVAAREVREREEFVLLDEQHLAYETVMHAVRRARHSDHKEVVIVTGGPGTGKSVIALSLLGEFYRNGHTALHATGSRSFTLTMRKVAGDRKPVVKKLFKYFNDFMAAEKNGLEVLLCDEAHRIRETSNQRWTPARLRTGKPQVEELIDAARVPVFLLDEHQVVRPGEQGTVPQIIEAAERRRLDWTLIELDAQFRCGGSEAYVHWTHRLLGFEEGGPIAWEPDGLMDLRVADSPAELEAFLRTKQTGGDRARMTAGYCWPWAKEEPNDGEPLPLDVVIGEWEKPWNLRGDRSVSGAPPAALWATDPAGFGQVGCVYTAQGFEYDWNGVIIGPDLVWREDGWVVNRAASHDPDLRRKSVTDEVVGRLVRNTYKVLLTRGMKGTILYSTDPETRAKLRELVESGRPVAAAV
ncbi:DNA/RNA helicase domain-containing protein [Streptomyces iakyrus]|uniref:DNA/RNA helicase domain-containing protein n=1 Tax=Streptomyces iakyrus TaxID=68219 RepID=UPI00369BDEDB